MMTPKVICLKMIQMRRTILDSGREFLLRFKRFEKGASQGAIYSNGSPLLARSHFGDLQCFHSMASKNGESVHETLSHILEWSEFLYRVSIGNIDPELTIGAISIGRMHEWFPGEAKEIKSIFLVGRMGDVRKRAIGALMHIIQDSFSASHVERSAAREIVEFHSYIGQDHQKHKEHDILIDGGIDKMPNALEAAELCRKALMYWQKISTMVKNEGILGKRSL